VLAAGIDAEGCPELYAGGYLVDVDGVVSSGIARYGDACPGPVGTPLCFGDGSGSACPCANSGAPGHGCENSAGLGGVQLAATGCPELRRILLVGTGFPPMAAPTVQPMRSRFLEPTPPVFGDGLLCLQAPVVRLTAGFAQGGTFRGPIQHGAMAGAFYYQLWYRNMPTFCTPETFNLSNAYGVTYP
jgi:hypothetical protein